MGSNGIAMFPGAENVVVQGGHFSVVQQPTVNTVVRDDGPSADVVAVLRRHSATAGLLNARERFDAPKCDEDTRLSMIRGLKHWVQSGHESRSSMFWLHGPAGVGKSALCQSLALDLQRDSNHAASFFFSRTSPGRNNGTQLVATLACQLAVHIPRIRPFISKSIANNPFIFESDNMVQMEKLIIEPAAQLHHSLRTWRTRLSQIVQWVPRPGRRKSAANRYNRTGGIDIPRLIVVDGLDECEHPAVQRDLILCLGHAVREMHLPFRIIIASRPESHILSTFKMHRLFNSPSGIILSAQDLGEDPEADQNITRFLMKEFAEIRRTHPLRNFLPDPWPQPEDVDHLVRKSSKGFIYPATVIRYIRMPTNRPDVCLRRILGVAKIPVFDKPYEPLDMLYHHIFESLPEANKESIHEVFQVLIAGMGMDVFAKLGSCVTPTIIERLLSYEPGHVEHILGDLLCLVNMRSHRAPIAIIHASLSDFFMDPVRSGGLHIDRGEASKMLAHHYLRIYCESEGRVTHGFDRVLLHTKEAIMLGATSRSVYMVDLVQCHTWAYQSYRERDSTLSDFVESSISFAGFMDMMLDEGCPLADIFEYLHGFEVYLRSSFPAVELVCSMEAVIVPYFMSLIRPFQHNHWLLYSLDFERRSSKFAAPQELSRGRALIMIPTFLGTDSAVDAVAAVPVDLTAGQKHAWLSILWIKAMFNTDPWGNTNNDMIRIVSFDMLRFSLEKADYYPPLITFLEGIETYGAQAASRVTMREMHAREMLVLQYLQRIQIFPLPMSLETAHQAWDGLAERWDNLGYYDTHEDRICAMAQAQIGLAI